MLVPAGLMLSSQSPSECQKRDLFLYGRGGVKGIFAHK